MSYDERGSCYRYLLFLCEDHSKRFREKRHNKRMVFEVIEKNILYTPTYVEKIIEP